MGVEQLTDMLGENVLTTTLGKVVGWGRANSVLAGARSLIWRPSWGFALMLGFLFALAFASLIDDSVKSVFIYFQF